FMLYIIYFISKLCSCKAKVNEQASHSSNKRSSAAAVVLGIKQVRIDDETHRLLTELGEFGETYGDIVARVTKHYASCPEVEKERKQQ
ncbi:MAG: hypothetical protein ACREAS_04730, partial [Nitrososphaera sp.]